MHHFVRGLLLLVVLLFTGCAAIGPAFTPAPDEAGNGILYVYRGTNKAFGARSAYFYVNDINVFDLDRNGYSWVSLPSGTYKVTQKWPIDIMTKSIETTIEIRAGEARYISFDTGFCQGGFGTICMSWVLRQENKDKAMWQITDKKFQPNFGLEKLKAAIRTSAKGVASPGEPPRD